MNKKEKFFGVNNTNWGHKWGFRDSGFIVNEDRSVTFAGNRYPICGKKLSKFIPFVEEVLGVEFKIKPKVEELDKKHVDEAFVNHDFISELRSRFNNDRFTEEDNERLLHSHGQHSTDEVYKVLYSKLKKFTDLVFYIESEEEAVELIELAKKHDVCLIPYGGGTNVTNALRPPEDEHRMIVTVDTRRLNKIESLDKENLMVTVQSGITGKDLEEALNKEGFTVGHEPDSYEFSTVGGWISTNAAGMKKHRYGNIEDIVQNLTMVTPSGTINQIKPLTRSSIGIKTQNILFGSEGNLGIITRATLKMHHLPAKSSYESIVLSDWQTGVQFMQDLSRSNMVPASSRLADNLQIRLGQALKEEKSGLPKILDKFKQFVLFKVKGFDPEKFTVAVFKIEGSEMEVKTQRKNLENLAKKHGGVVAGENTGKSGYLATMVIAYIRELIFTQNILGETMETAVPWSKINQVKEEASKLIVKLHKEHNLPGKPFFTSRISKVYHTGVCMYNTIAMCYDGVENPEDVFTEIEHIMRENFIENGGSISHHHGVGKLRKDFMPNTISEGSVEMIKGIKKNQDPHNVFGVNNNIVMD
ncbi:MAG: FAD-binding oxidoreductase [bacterium TMED46]|nr:MAG: FAD-binding oxidoreductase [bacterium TMED46]|tara:strand:- start:1274 stop:3031 length:1758 start_codon:yes stop_codon:yes gene_type:complete